MSLQRDPEGRYVIRGVEDDGPCVEFWTARRLPYDNKRDWEKRLIEDLAQRLKRLVENTDRDDGRWLRAVFASDDPINCDAGNLTYLNLGTRPFTPRGYRISFERWYDVPDAPAP